MHVYSLGILYFSGGSRISLSFPDPLVVTLVDPPVTALYLDIPEDGTIDKQGVQISLASNILVSLVSKKPKAVGVVDKHPRVTTENTEKLTTYLPLLVNLSAVALAPKVLQRYIFSAAVLLLNIS